MFGLECNLFRFKPRLSLGTGTDRCFGILEVATCLIPLVTYKQQKRRCIHSG